ncbi:MAG: hypothetical protein KY468_09080 [Armatimonadetes bacterium]|nr:hypothetical protein [Armatimonadota bacterium]
MSDPQDDVQDRLLQVYARDEEDAGEAGAITGGSGVTPAGGPSGSRITTTPTGA